MCTRSPFDRLRACPVLDTGMSGKRAPHAPTIPAKAGIQGVVEGMDSRLRGSGLCPPFLRRQESRGRVGGGGFRFLTKFTLSVAEGFGMTA